MKDVYLHVECFLANRKSTCHVHVAINQVQQQLQHLSGSKRRLLQAVSSAYRLLWLLLCCWLSWCCLLLLCLLCHLCCKVVGLLLKALTKVELHKAANLQDKHHMPLLYSVNTSFK